MRDVVKWLETPVVLKLGGLPSSRLNLGKFSRRWSETNVKIISGRNKFENLFIL